MARKILVVDDDEMVLIALEELLRSKGYEIGTASGGKEALEKIERESFDLVILDLVMPGMDGYEVCRRIRSNELYREIPVVMLTALTGEEDRKKGEDAGANLFLPKPISPQRLLSLIESALS
jgi:CheY-like chemotaxis protein